jgi:hypothetical protein
VRDAGYMAPGFLLGIPQRSEARGDIARHIRGPGLPSLGCSPETPAQRNVEGADAGEALAQTDRSTTGDRGLRRFPGRHQEDNPPHSGRAKSQREARASWTENITVSLKQSLGCVRRAADEGKRGAG